MAICLDIKVTPQSGKQQFIRDKSGIIKCLLKSPPEGGKANAELIKFLSKKLSLPQENIIILQGVTSRRKTVKIDTLLDMATVFYKLGLETQMTL